jgi:hypothetical protein
MTQSSLCTGMWLLGFRRVGGGVVSHLRMDGDSASRLSRRLRAANNGENCLTTVTRAAYAFAPDFPTLVRHCLLACSSRGRYDKGRVRRSRRSRRAGAEAPDGSCDHTVLGGDQVPGITAGKAFQGLVQTDAILTKDANNGAARQQLPWW